MIFVIGFLCPTTVAVGGFGIASLGAANAAIQTHCKDRVPALGQLRSISRLMQANRPTPATVITVNRNELGATASEAAGRIVRDKLVELFKPAPDNMKALVQPQFNVGKAWYESAQSRLRRSASGSSAASPNRWRRRWSWRKAWPLPAQALRCTTTSR